MSFPEDPDFWDRVCSNDLEAVEELYDNVIDRITVVARMMLGNDEDGFSEVLSCTWRSAVGRICRKRLDGENNVRAYFGAIATNCAKKYLAKRNLRQAREGNDSLKGEFGQVVKETQSISEIVERKEVEKELAKCMESLPAKFADVISIRYFEDLDWSEISDHLGEPAGTLKSRWKRALQLLKACLSQKGIR